MDGKPNAIDLFAGAGGLSKGLEQAGYNIVYALDYNEKCRDTYDQNHDVDLTVGDITEIRPRDLDIEKDEVDFIAGGPPCPTFSLVGRTKINSIKERSTEEDERHSLYEDFLRFVHYFEPDAFVMENVAGMKSSENKEGRPVYKVIKDQMEDLGYNVTAQVVDAADYGVPQHRERIFFIGNKHNLSNPDLKKWESHTEPSTDSERGIKYRGLSEKHENQKKIPGLSNGGKRGFPEYRRNMDKKPWNTVADALLDLPPLSPDGETPPTQHQNYTIPAVSTYQDWVRDLKKGESWKSKHLDSHVCRGHNLRDLTLYKMLGEGTSYKIGDLPDSIQPYREDIFNDNIKKLNPNEPSNTIVAHLQKDGHMFVHPSEARSISVREAARLQSFKDSFTFPVKRTHAYKQIGNAVPPLLAMAIGQATKYRIFEKIQQKK